MDTKQYYSYKDSFLWGFGSDWLNKPKENDRLRLKFTAPKNIQSFRDEIFRATKLIAEDSKKPIVLAMAGGYDSQAIAIALKDQKIPFKAVTKVIAIDGKCVNELDVNNAIEFCNRFKIEQDLLFVNLNEKIEAHLALAKEYSPVHFVHYTNTDLVKEYRDFNVILGNGDPNIEVYSDKDIFNLMIRKDLHREHADLGGTTVDRFYLYTPELFFSYLFHPFCFLFDKAKDAYLEHYKMEAVKEHNQYMVFKRFIKPLIFAEHFEEIKHVPKMNGFESYSGYWNIKKRYQSQGDTSLKTFVSVTREDWLKLYNREVEELVITA